MLLKTKSKLLEAIDSSLFELSLIESEENKELIATLKKAKKLAK